ncbi:sigma factor-like helix-turn-helix DNA-binding protein [Sphingomonas lycopersici]|uniref:RNA polymerase subunit sigma n=1 Tax=Sphingomonas lycopersici TaxID=2951807 RepID=A0AA42CVM9_9SPHN|nr:sigma factor-like helix-turn-helix DNA-binding protein [Sphingomonas lycopersici]MCW6536763.1 RNA polymerase subunit sigma [Sphingomonas lycopersici]
MSENLGDEEIIERLEAGLQRLPKLRREIFLAIRLDDLSYAEIAERTGLSVEQVERHFAQSMLALRDALAGRPPVSWWKRILRRVAERQWR